MKKWIYIIIILFGLLTLSILGSSFKITEGNYSNENNASVYSPSKQTHACPAIPQLGKRVLRL